MATVYLARDRELGREVALKVLRLPGAGARDRASACGGRPASWPGSSIPASFPCTTSGTLSGRPRLLRDEARPRPAARRAPARRAIPSPAAPPVRADLRDGGLRSRPGVIHRDLKPENVMVGPFGEVLVLDWGVAKLSGEPEAPSPGPWSCRRSETAHGTVVGTAGLHVARAGPRPGGRRAGRRLRPRPHPRVDAGRPRPRPTGTDPCPGAAAASPRSSRRPWPPRPTSGTLAPASWARTSRGTCRVSACLAHREGVVRGARPARRQVQDAHRP